LEVIKNADVRIQKSPKGGSYSRNSDGVIFIDPTVKEERVYDRQDIITHELSHNKSRDSRSKSNPAGNLFNTHFRGPYEFNADFDPFIERSRIQDYHDANPDEYKADVNALRFRFMRDGIYDPMNQDFTKEHLEKARSNKKLSKDPIFQRFLRLSKDDDAAIKALNSITSIEDKTDVSSAAYGGELANNQMKRKKKYAYGGTYQPVGLPVDPADIRAQKAQQRKEEGNFWTGLGRFATDYALPMIASAVGGPGAGVIARGISSRLGNNSQGNFAPVTSLPDSPTIDYVDPSFELDNGIRTSAYGGPVLPPMYSDTIPAPNYFPAVMWNTPAPTRDTSYDREYQRAQMRQDSMLKYRNTRRSMSNATGIDYGSPMNTSYLPDRDYRGGEMNRKSKSRDRFREYDSGGRTSRFPHDSTVSQFDWVNQGVPSANSTSKRGLEESNRRVLAEGDTGEEVAQLQNFLKAKGFYKGDVDSKFGKRTKKAVKDYQQWFNDNAKYPVNYVQNGNIVLSGPGHKKVDVDGVVGDETRAALMYREMPEPKYTPKREPAPSPAPSTSRQYTTTDNNANAGPVIMDYLYGPLLGAAGAAAGYGIASAASAIGAEATATGIASTIARLGRRPEGAIRPPLNPNVPTAPTAPGNPGPRAFPPKTPSSYGTRVQYADGGDIDLSNDSFQVKGNPNVTDSELYDTPQGPIKLDHDEVIKGTFAFSNKLRNPLTNKTFAAEAAPIQRGIGKAEKRITRVGKDKFSDATIKYATQRSESLATAQEIVATLKGKRNPDGSTVQRYAWGGGPDDPPQDTIPPYPYPRRMMSTQDMQWFNTKQGLTTPWDWEYLQTGQIGRDPVPTKATTPVANKGKARSKAMSTEEFYNKYPGSRPYPNWPVQSTYENPFSTAPLQPLPTANPALQVPYTGVVSQKGSFEDRYSQLPPDLKKSLTTSPAAATPGTTNTGATGNYGNTVGDLLQLMEVGSKFGQLIGGPEKEPTYQDNTPITQQAYDVSPVLQQNQANYQNALNSVDTSSLNLRRALGAQFYANKIDADSRVLSQYQEMNNQSKTQFQDRTSAQRRSNIGLKMAADQMNAQNRGRYNDAVQNAFTSLGNYGQAMNQRQQSMEALNILRAIYPDVYARIMSQANGTK